MQDRGSLTAAFHAEPLWRVFLEGGGDPARRAPHEALRLTLGRAGAVGASEMAAGTMVGSAPASWASRPNRSPASGTANRRAGRPAHALNVLGYPSRPRP